MPTERQKMIKGEFYNANDAELVSMRRAARTLLSMLNASGDGERELRTDIYRELFGTAGEALHIEPPFYCDYGSNIHLGARVFLNFNCVILDPAEVMIGDDVLFGPAVQIYTATHPLEPGIRRSGLEMARPIEIGSGVWIGGGTMINPGARIGQGSVIGAGSVVTRNVPEGVVAAGNPCRVLKEL
jgi:maltose O-acetyltransferase